MLLTLIDSDTPFLPTCSCVRLLEPMCSFPVALNHQVLLRWCDILRRVEGRWRSRK